METAAMMAFLADFCSSIMNQASFALQKSIHQDEEKAVLNKSNDTSGEVSTNKESKSSICTGKGASAMILLIVAAIFHIVALANADITLLSCNASTSIVANVFISINFLNEKFDPKNDIPGLVLIGVGCTIIVLLSNKESEEPSLVELVELLTSRKSIFYLCLASLVVNSSKYIMPQMLKQLRKFEKDCDKWDN